MTYKDPDYQRKYRECPHETERKKLFGIKSNANSGLWVKDGILIDFGALRKELEQLLPYNEES